MKAYDHPNYDETCPEKFNWRLIDSHKLTSVAQRLADLIEDDSETPERLFTPGLRFALNVIAKESELI
jgi:hypothetical protein